MGQFFKDEMFDAQFYRALGMTYYGAADIGECLALARRIPDRDPERWYVEWTALAERIYDAGQASLVAGHRVSARDAFFRAFNYFRASYTFLFQAPLDPRAVRAYERQEEAFARGMALMETPGEAMQIPFAGSPLRGLFFRPDMSGKARRTLIINNGYDGTAEEVFFYSGPAALARGYNVLVFDGPGQGRALMKHAIPLRPDWENVIRPVMDCLLARPDVDAQRVALLGVSLGGYLAPRAASGEPRLAALVADPGQMSVLEEGRAQMPGWIARQVPDGNRLILALLGRMLEKRAKDVSGGWGLRRGMLVHGCATPLAYLKDTATYTVAGRAHEIACPTMICVTEGEGIGRTAKRLFDALTCEKRFHVFAAADGAAAHCESGARALFNREMFDWLDTVLDR
ncbi:alpha/beta fold hydrolase [Aquabacter spiritensis]|uniref:Alpha/beta hydrolase family protein n=1 Tax=Aquabacter spiritensis TaxID=933073 RepID=A0A4R3M231_9HYPH|nr:alpha/beta fold hydrolase [Aquabacter spiritensis]TCT06746.1 alpha/beta hydrolase family protein [Aquabacter spiritensis]